MVDLFGMVDMLDMVDIIDMVDKMKMVDNVDMLDSIDMVNIQKTFGYLKLQVDTSGWTRLTWRYGEHGRHGGQH